MIAEIGQFALILALVIAIIQGTLPLAGAALNRAQWVAVAKPAARGQFLFVIIAFLCLMHAYVTSDFSVANVAHNSHTLKPLLYKISGVWGNHEGSMVLWVTILALFGLAVAEFGTGLPPTLRARVLSIQGLIGVASTRMTTSSDAGVGVSISANSSFSSPALEMVERSCRGMERPRWVAGAQTLAARPGCGSYRAHRQEQCPDRVRCGRRVQLPRATWFNREHR